MRVSLAVLLLPLLAACGPSPEGEHLGTATQANVCATGTVLQGVDVSTYDGKVDWATASANGIVFAIAKATEGETLVDNQFAANWAAMPQHGVIRGAYHFFHCADDPTKQAQFFLETMGTLQKGDLPPTLDFEDASCSSSTGITLAIQWLDAVASATGTLPIIYASPGFLEGFANTSQLSAHAQLWVADWGPSCPIVPAPYSTWPLWQYSATGTTPGVGSAGMGDLDEFNGDLAALMAMTLGGGGSSSTTSTGSSGTGGSSGAPTCMVDGVTGTCIDTSVCAAMPGYESTPNLCPGPASEQCCTKVSSGTGGSGTGGAPGSTSSATGGGATNGSTTTGSATGSTTGNGTSTAATTGGSSGHAGTGAGTAFAPNASSSCALHPASSSDASGLRAAAAALAFAALRRRRSRARRRS